MKTRPHRVLLCLAGAPAGLTCRELTDRLGHEEGRGMDLNAKSLVDLAHRGFVERETPRRASVIRITAAGRRHLRQLEDGTYQRAPRCDAGVARVHWPQQDLADEPVQRRTVAVDGQAPRHLPNSVFNLVPRELIGLEEGQLHA